MKWYDFFKGSPDHPIYIKSLKLADEDAAVEICLEKGLGYWGAIRFQESFITLRDTGITFAEFPDEDDYFIVLGPGVQT